MFSEAIKASLIPKRGQLLRQIRENGVAKFFKAKRKKETVVSEGGGEGQKQKKTREIFQRATHIEEDAF